MALDGIVLRAVTHELQQLTGGRINKIHQPTSSDIVMQVRAKGKNYKLLISANPTYPRIHLTETSYQNPLQAPMFCMLLRKHCEQGTIESIEQTGLERVLHMNIRSRDELGDVNIKRIIIELTGRHSNIILIDPSKQLVLDSIHHINASMSRYRTVLPGSTYVPPPEQNKINPLEADQRKIDELLQQLEPEAIPKQIVSLFTGISPLNASEITYRAASIEEDARKHLPEIFHSVMSQIREHQYAPQIAETPDRKSFFSVIDLTHVKGDITEFASTSRMLEAYYGEKAAKDAVKQKSSTLYKLLQNELQKNKKKRKILQKTIEEAQTADQYRIMGELLIANLHQVQRGDAELETINYYEPEQPLIKIPLDAGKSPSDNAQSYFKKYNKLKNSLSHAEEQLKLTEAEIEYLENLLHQLEDATIQDLEEIREELEQEGYVRKKASSRRSKKNSRPALLRYVSSDGTPIYVGKNNLQNEYLTNRLARPADTWLHTKDIPGSHVVIRSSNYSDATLEEAAMLAAYYSKGKESSQVPVDYTLIKHVRKPSGAKPGFVIYDHQKTIYVTPDAKKIQSMQMEQE